MQLYHKNLRKYTATLHSFIIVHQIFFENKFHFQNFSEKIDKTTSFCLEKILSIIEFRSIVSADRIGLDSIIPISSVKVHLFAL